MPTTPDDPNAFEIDSQGFYTMQTLWAHWIAYASKTPGSENISFKDYVELLKQGGGHYKIYAYNQEGKYRKGQDVDPLQDIVFVLGNKSAEYPTKAHPNAGQTAGFNSDGTLYLVGTGNLGSIGEKMLNRPDIAYRFAYAPNLNFSNSPIKYLFYPNDYIEVALNRNDHRVPHMTDSRPVDWNNRLGALADSIYIGRRDTRGDSETALEKFKQVLLASRFENFPIEIDASWVN